MRLTPRPMSRRMVSVCCHRTSILLFMPSEIASTQDYMSDLISTQSISVFPGGSVANM